MTADIDAVGDSLDNYARVLSEEYFATLERIGRSNPLEIFEFFRHLIVRATLGQDEPDDRRAIAVVGLELCSALSSEAKRLTMPRSRAGVTKFEDLRELFQDLASGAKVDLNLMNPDLVGTAVIHGGEQRVGLKHGRDLGREAWTIQLGPAPRPARPDQLAPYMQLGVVAALRNYHTNTQLLADEISPEEWVERWLLLWRRQVLRVLVEPAVPGGLRRALAAGASVTMAQLNELCSRRDDVVDVADVHGKELEIWHRVMVQIQDGGFLVATLAAADRRLGSVRFEKRQRFEDGEISPLEAGILETFSRVSGCDLLPEPAGRISTAPSGRRKDVGRNAPCPCGSGKKYKRCCLDD